MKIMRSLRAHLQVFPIFFTLIILILILYPIGTIVLGSFKPTFPWEPSGLTLRNFFNVFNDPLYLKAFSNTLISSTIGTVLAVGLGLGFAFLTVKTNAPLKGLIDIAVVIPYFFSPFIGALAWTFIGAPSMGILNRPFVSETDPYGPFNIYSLAGMSMVMGLYSVPIAYLLISSAMKNMDASPEDAAAVTGASGLKIVQKVTLPLLAPSIVTTAVLIFVQIAEMFGVAAVLAIPARFDTLATKIYYDIAEFANIEQFGKAEAGAILLLVITLAGVWFYRRRTRMHMRFITVTGRARAAKVFDLGKWRYVVLVPSILYFLTVLILPYGGLVFASFQTYWGSKVTPFTLKNYVDVFDNPLFIRALTNSLILSIVSGAILVLLGFIIAYLVQRGKFIGRSSLDYVATLPAAFPSTVIGLAMLLAWIQTPIYGTLWLLLVAYIIRYMPYAVRSVSYQLMQQGLEIEESAKICGSSWIRTFSRIMLPLMKTGLGATWIILFISILRELGAVIFIIGWGTEVVPTLLLSVWQHGLNTRLASLATILAVIMMGGVIILRKVFKIEITL